jgi:hypothetical protein
MADHLDEGTEQLRMELAAWQEADAELEALRTSAGRVQDIVLDNADRPSFPMASMLMEVELLGSQIDAMATNDARWGSRSALVATVSHFL